jgi:hypothetical protein
MPARVRYRYRPAAAPEVLPRAEWRRPFRPPGRSSAVRGADQVRRPPVQRVLPCRMHPRWAARQPERACLETSANGGMGVTRTSVGSQAIWRVRACGRGEAVTRSDEQRRGPWSSSSSSCQDDPAEWQHWVHGYRAARDKSGGLHLHQDMDGKCAPVNMMPAGTWVDGWLAWDHWEGGCWRALVPCTARRHGSPPSRGDIRRVPLRAATAATPLSEPVAAELSGTRPGTERMFASGSTPLCREVCGEPTTPRARPPAEGCRRASHPCPRRSCRRSSRP